MEMSFKRGRLIGRKSVVLRSSQADPEKTGTLVYFCHSVTSRVLSRVVSK